MMPLLKTKFYIPPLQPGIVSRPHLVARLGTGLRSAKKLSLISAPAGFGKTTLLSEWVASTDWPVAWLSLDGGDNDPARFWTYVAEALQSALPASGGWLARGNPTAAWRCAQGGGLRVDDEIAFYHQREYGTLAKTLIAGGQLEAARTLLARLLARAETAGAIGLAIKVLALQAVALQVGGKPTQALAALNRALALGEAGGYVRSILDAGAPVASLLHTALAPPAVHARYARRLMAALSSESSDTGSTVHGPAQPASARCCACSPPTSLGPRSRSGSTSLPTRSAFTSKTSMASWASTAALRPSGARKNCT